MITKRQVEVFKVLYIQIRHITDTLSKRYYIWYLSTIPGRIDPSISAEESAEFQGQFRAFEMARHELTRCVTRRLRFSDEQPPGTSCNWTGLQEDSRYGLATPR